MANELDELMSLDPLEMSSRDIDAIIAHHRRQRANFEAGKKPEKESGPKKTIDLAALGLAKKAEPIKRRF